MYIKEVGVSYCGKTGFYQLSIFKCDEIIESGHKPNITIYSPEFTVCDHIWKLKFWLCPNHLHYELDKITASTFEFHYQIKVLSHIERMNDIVANAAYLVQGILKFFLLLYTK